MHYSGTVRVKQDQTASFSGKWTVLSGTGKLKGIKGSGTYKGTAAADGSSDVDVEGEYTIEEKPAAPHKAPAKKCIQRRIEHSTPGNCGCGRQDNLAAPATVFPLLYIQTANDWPS